MELDLACVDSFMVLVDERHLGHAARRQNLTTSALSKRIRRLEQQVGVELVERGPVGVVAVTAAGMRFAQHAEALMASAHAAREAARSEPSPYSVRLGVPGMIGEYPQRFELEAAAGELRRLLPNVRLHCYGIPFDALASSLLDGLIDVLWTASEATDVRLESTPVGALWRAGIVSARHELAQATEVALADFLDYPMIYDPDLPSAWMAQWYFGDVRTRDEAALVAIAARNVACVLESVARGAGVAAAPARLATRLSPEFHAVTVQGSPPILYHAVRRRTDHREPVLALVQALAVLAGEPVAGVSTTTTGTAT